MNPDLSLMGIVGLSDATIQDVFEYARWGNSPHCIKCGADCYRYKTRLIFRCKGCDAQFSVTSGNALSLSKLPKRTILIAISLFLSGAKGTASLQLSRTLKCQYKTAFVLAHKIRQALYEAQKEIPALTGNVEIDGAIFGGYTERFNYVDKRTGKIACRRRHGQRRVVVVVRQRGGRTLTKVVRKESQALPFIRSRVSASATIHADLFRGWDSLRDLYKMMRIGHNEAFSFGGACTNNAESFFGLLRRKQMGIHHRMSGENLDLYAAELAWRVDHRHLTESEMVLAILRELLQRAKTEKWASYWQKKRKDTIPVSLEPKPIKTWDFSNHNIGACA